MTRNVMEPRTEVAADRTGQPLLARAAPYLLPAATALCCVLFWEAFCRLSGVHPVILPSPSAIVAKFLRFFPLLLSHAVPTTLEALAAFVLACMLGCGLAAVVVVSRRMRLALWPNLVFFQLIPKIALAPLFVVWFGLGPEARLSFSVFVSFFPVVIATLAGLDNVERDLLRLCRALTASNWQTFVSVRLPHAVPYIFSGMKIASTFAIIGVIVGEFITSKAGLGYLILFASAQAETALIFASIAVLCAFGLCFYGLVAIAEQWTIRVFGDAPR